MKINYKLRAAATVAVLFLLLWTATETRAQSVNVILNPASLSAPPGANQVVFGTLTNLTTTEIFLNSFTVNFFPGSLLPVVDGTPFVTSVPLSLTGAGAGSSYTGDIFGLFIDPAAAPGTIYAGRFELFGGADGSSSDLIGFQDFFFTVSAPAAAIPEPGTWLLLSISALLVGAVAWKRRRAGEEACAAAAVADAT